MNYELSFLERLFSFLRVLYQRFNCKNILIPTAAATLHEQPSDGVEGIL